MLDSSLHNTLSKFLVVAKRQTYAGQDDDATLPNPLLEGSMQLEFSDGNWMYRDIYQGLSFFTGMETVYFENEPVWAMSYSGGASSNLRPEEAKQVYVFLRTALMQVSDELPIRGPSKHVMGNASYNMSCEGTLSRFRGIEEILISNVCKYRLSFAGGFVL